MTVLTKDDNGDDDCEDDCDQKKGEEDENDNANYDDDTNDDDSKDDGDADVQVRIIPRGVILEQMRIPPRLGGLNLLWVSQRAHISYNSEVHGIASLRQSCQQSPLKSK